MIPKINTIDLITKDQKEELIISTINKLIDLQKPLFLKDGPTITWDIQKGYNAHVTLKGNRTLVITNLTPGDYGTIVVSQDIVGARTLTVPAGSIVSNNGLGSLTLTPIVYAKDIVCFYYDQNEVLNFNVVNNLT